MNLGERLMTICERNYRFTSFCAVATWFVIAAVTSSCGGATPTRALPGPRLGRVRAAMSGARTAKVGIRVSLSNGKTALETGELDFVHKLGHITPIQAGSPTLTEMLLTPDRLLIKVPAGTPGKPWIGIVTQNSTASPSVPSNPVDPLALFDPPSSARDLWVDLGRESVGGQATTHLSRRSESGGGADIWINDTGLLRRVRITHIALPPSDIEGTETIDYFDFGSPVTILVPSPADVESMTPAS